MNDTSTWWEPAPGYQWIGQGDSRITSLIALFAQVGFQLCDSQAVEADFDKVALYEKDGTWTHASRQLANGQWTSKLGQDEDIEHQSPHCLEGDIYGRVHCIMKKRKP